MPASSMISSVDGPTAAAPVRQFTVVEGPCEFGERIAADAGLLRQDGRCGSRRGQADHLTAVLGPRESEGAHGGGLAGASGGDRKLQTRPGAAHPADQCRLPSIQWSAVRCHFEQGRAM